MAEAEERALNMSLRPLDMEAMLRAVSIHCQQVLLLNVFPPRHTFLEPLTRRHTAFMALILYNTYIMMYDMF